MQLGLGFWGSKTFLSAIELGVFTELAKGPQDGESSAGGHAQRIQMLYEYRNLMNRGSAQNGLLPK
jgi:hypothetical protein